MRRRDRLREEWRECEMSGGSARGIERVRKDGRMCKRR